MKTTWFYFFFLKQVLQIPEIAHNKIVIPQRFVRNSEAFLPYLLPVFILQICVRKILVLVIYTCAALNLLKGVSNTPKKII